MGYLCVELLFVSLVTLKLFVSVSLGLLERQLLMC